ASRAPSTWKWPITAIALLRGCGHGRSYDPGAAARRSSAGQDRPRLPQPLDLRVDRAAAGADREVRGAEATPHLDRRAPLVRATLAGVEPPLEPERRAVAPGFAQEAVDLLDRRLPSALERAQRQVAVADRAGAPDRRLGRGADPERDRALDRPGI